MATNDTVQLSVIGKADSQDHIHTLHFRIIDPTQFEQDLINLWQANCRTTYRALFDDGDTPVQLIRAQQVCGSVPLRAAVEEAEAAGNQAGTTAYSGERAPSWLARVASLRTQFAGKSRRGRFFIGGMFEIMSTGNDLIAGEVTRMNDYVTALLNTFGPAVVDPDFRWVVHSRKLASVVGTACQDSSTLITSVLVRSAVGSMKSRKPGSGN